MERGKGYSVSILGHSSNSRERKRERKRRREEREEKMYVEFCPVEDNL